MSKPIHLLLTGADLHPPSALPSLPSLTRALQHWHMQPITPANPDAPLTLAETLLAQRLGLPGASGHHPFAAMDAGVHSSACAWLTPCHVQLGMDRAQLHNPEHLELTEVQSRALFAAVAPLWAEEGVTLQWIGPLRWLASADWLADAHCISLAQAGQGMLHHHQITPDVPTQSAATRARLLRLRNETEMLLYTHAVTDERAALRLPAINSMWLHGAGTLTADEALHVNTQRLRVHLDSRLSDAAEQGGQTAWQTAWQSMEAELATRLNDLRSQPQASLTLCGNDAALTLTPAPASLLHTFTRLIRPVNLAHMLTRMHTPTDEARHAL